MDNEKKNGRLTVALCFLMIFAGLGFVSAPRTLFVIPVTEALSIDRSVYSVVDSLRYVSTAVVNLFFGTLIAKFGARWLIAIGFLALALSMLFFGLANGLVLLYLAGILMGIGFSFTSTAMVGYVIRRAYPERSGTITGAVLAANGIGGAACTPIVSAMIHSGIGYRGSSYAVCALVALVGLVTVAFLRGPAVCRPAKQEASKAEESEPAPTEGTPPLRFILLVAAVFFSGFCLQGIYGVSAAHMTDVGLDEGLIVSVLSTQLLLLAASKFLIGALYDRFGLRVTATVTMLGGMGVSVLLALLVSGTAGAVMAFGYALLVSVALPLETVMLPIYAREFFGKAQFASRLGILVSFNTVGYALGSPFLNLVFDLSGSYTAGFITTAALMSLSLIFMLAICPRRTK